MKFVDDILNSVTMYRLVLYVLIFLLTVATIFGFTGIISYSGESIILSTSFIVLVAWSVNKLFAKVFGVSSNPESSIITGLILALLIAPSSGLAGFDLPFWAAVLAVASKYILTVNKKHIFNPAAIAVFITSIVLNKSAVWWVGTASMLPAVLLAGFLVVRKIRRFDLVYYFFLSALTTTALFSISLGKDVLQSFIHEIADSPLVFFATIMVTEPLTMPPTALTQSIYGALVGFISYPDIHISSFFFTPESALMVGNLLSYLTSFRQRLTLTLTQKVEVARGTFDFVFAAPQGFNFTPGKYMEWTLGHTRADSRGIRRFLTIASSPTENNVRIGVKYSDNSSSFKRKLLTLTPGMVISASQLEGDFLLSKDENQELVFIAGGIGVTPFRSMVKYISDSGQRRKVTLLYFNKTADEICYKDVFDEGKSKFGLQTVYSLTDKDQLPSNWKGESGRLGNDMLVKYVPNRENAIFYISGPNSMVEASKSLLKSQGVPSSRIRTDYFPGY